MTKAFDEAYANYLAALAQLDSTHDIAEKNLLFKKLTEQLSELESRINQHDFMWDPCSEEDIDLL